MTPPIKSAKWQTVHSSIVCSQIAHVALSADDGVAGEQPNRVVVAGKRPRLGQITLRDHQLDALLRVRAAIRQFGGALLADEVGLGKTYVALALARDYDVVHILAPAALIPMWRSSFLVTECKHASLFSLHRLSRAPINTQRTAGRTLVIVDEAHHLRTRATARYTNAIAFTANRDVLLLTATPLHNRTSELRNLLALFLGSRADALDNATLAQCVVRRTGQDAGPVNIPTVREHAAHRMPDNHMVLEALLTLPPPLPVHDGSAASALVRLGLLRAWCSSDAALSDGIRRRQLRGEALLHSLTHGRYPTRRELQSWIVSNDSVQLGFPELLVATASENTSEMLKTLLAHMDGLQALLQLHTRTSMADARRAELLRSLVGTESLTMNMGALRIDHSASGVHETPVPPAIVAFSQFASTVRALHRALSDLAGIALLTSDGGRIASGAIPRQELIASFAPKAHGRPPPRAHERIRLLLTTDLLAEGVNLQDAGVVVHLDLPWTHALKQQRVGRLARMNSGHAIVDVHTFEPPMGADAILRIVATLERKAGLHHQFVGHEIESSGATPAHALSGADEATQLRACWRLWQHLSGNSESVPTSPFNQFTIASAEASANGWVATVRLPNNMTVVASRSGEGVGSDVATVLRVVKGIDCEPVAFSPYSTRDNDVAPNHLVGRALRQLQRWMKTQALQQSAGPHSRSLAPIQKRALDTLASRFGMMPALLRTSIAPLMTQVEASVLSARGAGAEQSIERWMLSSYTLPLAEWLSAFPPELTIPLHSSPEHDRLKANEWQVISLLILRKRSNGHSLNALE